MHIFLEKPSYLLRFVSVNPLEQFLLLKDLTFQAEILHFPNLFWPLKAIKILLNYFDHQIKTKTSLIFNMRLILDFLLFPVIF